MFHDEKFGASAFDAVCADHVDGRPADHVDACAAAGLRSISVSSSGGRAAEVEPGSLRPAAAVPRIGVAARAVKSIFDRLAAITALVVLAPVLLGIALAVRCTSRGPALFRQTRVGRNGRTFTMIKFRSMYVGSQALVATLQDSNEVSGGVLFKIRDDPRVTPVGGLLRRMSLDELPQLLNVVTGSMSLVGPRPPLPSEVRKYDSDERRRLLVKPGMTGLWQVSGRSDLSWDESIRLDLRYVEDWSLALDTVVLAKTVRAVVSANGAY